MKPIYLIIVAVILIIISSSVFTVREDQLAIKFRLGEVQRVDYEPGLHFKLPFINNVRKFDSRVYSLDTQPERYITSEKKDVIVDSFVKWRIQNVRDFYGTTGGSDVTANMRLSQIVKDGLRAEFASRTLQEVVSAERGNVMDALVASANVGAANLGIRIIDLRVKRIELPEEVSESVFNRMRAERLRVANELRSQGVEAGERIRADADRQVVVTLAEARRDAERLRGEGDALAAATYADAFNRNPEFYSFNRSLEAYRRAFEAGDDMLVLDPKSEFFQHFDGAGMLPPAQ